MSDLEAAVLTLARSLPTGQCERLAPGESLNEICRSAHLPTAPAIRRWVMEDRDGFSARYARARDLQLESWADQIIEIADDGSNDWMERNKPDNPGWQANGEHVQRSRLRTDNRRWLLSKLRPDKYGEKLQTENKTTIEVDPVGADQRIVALLMKAGLTEDEARAALHAHTG